eukprot:24918_1
MLHRWNPKPLHFNDCPYLPVPPSMTLNQNDLCDKLNKTNLLSADYLGLASNEHIKSVAKDGITRYNVGSSSVRIFYGTMDVHVQLEHALTQHFESNPTEIGRKSAVIYSDYVSVPSAVIKCFVKPKDLLIMDEGCHSLFMAGVTLSKAHVMYYKHNDLDSFKACLQESSHKYPKCNKFIVTEGVFNHYGDVCHLKQIIQIAKSMKQRYFVILDDSHAFGVLHSRGSIGYHGLSILDIDIYLCSMETALASRGSFCIVDKELDQLTRFTCNPYIFSASSPPYLPMVANAALKIIHKNGDELRKHIQRKAKLIRECLSSNSDDWYVDGQDDIPLIHLRFGHQNSIRCIQRICEAANQENILISSFIVPKHDNIRTGNRTTPPSLKLLINVLHSDTQIKESAMILKRIINGVISTPNHVHTDNKNDDNGQQHFQSVKVTSNQSQSPNPMNLNEIKPSQKSSQITDNYMMKVGVLWSLTKNALIHSWFHRTRSEHPLSFQGFQVLWVQHIFGPFLDIGHRVVSDQGGGKYIQLQSESKPCLNTGSYGYSGLGDIDFKKDVLSTMDKYGHSLSIAPSAAMVDLHKKLETKLTTFINNIHFGASDTILKDRDTMIFDSGWSTNFSAISHLIRGKKNLIISDSLNHNSIAMGAKLSGTKIKVFKHNDMKDLERIIVDSIAQNKWEKILIVVEGVYSMDGDYCDLPRIVELKERYKCYLYIDEAHSMGSIGETGRGICELFKIDSSKIDILMGSLSKGFGLSIGGYVSGRKSVIDHIRRHNFSNYYGTGIAPPCIQQIISALDHMDTDAFKNKMRHFRQKTDFIRKTFVAKGLIVYGDYGTPIIPIGIPYYPQIMLFSRRMLEEGIAVSVVMYPATSIYSGRIRFCLNPNFSDDDVSKLIATTLRVGAELSIFYNKSFFRSKL